MKKYLLLRDFQAFTTRADIIDILLDYRENADYLHYITNKLGESYFGCAGPVPANVVELAIIEKSIELTMYWSWLVLR